MEADGPAVPIKLIETPILEEKVSEPTDTSNILKPKVMNMI